MCKIKIFTPYQNYFSKPEFQDFKSIMQLAGDQVFKENKHRNVVRFSLVSDGKEKTFFLKRHLIPELKDKWRDLLAFHWPLSDAKQEYDNIQRVAHLGIPTMQSAGWGEEKKGFLKKRSFLITESLGDLERLENVVVTKYAKPLSQAERKEKQDLIGQVAQMAAKFHRAKLSHRDFYCGHILVKEEVASCKLFLIDLQRVRKHRYLRRRWRTKDVASLNYTADSRAISRTDKLRFFLAYSGLPRLTRSHKKWIRQILHRTARIEQHTAKKRARYQKAAI